MPTDCSEKTSFRKRALGEPHEGDSLGKFSSSPSRVPGITPVESTQNLVSAKRANRILGLCLEIFPPSCLACHRRPDQFTRIHRGGGGGGEGETSPFSPGSAFVSRSPSTSLSLSEIDIPVAEINPRERERHSSSPLPQIRVQPR